MVGSAGLGDRYIGASGFDWADFKDDAFGVTIDMSDRFFDQPPVPGSGASALARFDIVEGLSGSAFGDVLQGDNVDRGGAARSAGAQGSVLTNIALIDGLQDFLDAVLGTPRRPSTFFDGGNIILGGDGGDIIEGRGGNDLIDGDAWLNVRISVRANPDGTGAEIASFDSMEPTGSVHARRRPTIPASSGSCARSSTRMAPTSTRPCSPATWRTTRSRIDDSGTADFVDDIVTVTDNVGTDGTDTLKHIERLQFADQSIVLGGLNNEPAGLLTILDAATNTPDDTPTEDQPLTGVDRRCDRCGQPWRRLDVHPGRSPTSGRSNCAQARASSKTSFSTSLPAKWRASRV